MEKALDLRRAFALMTQGPGSCTFHVEKWGIVMHNFPRQRTEQSKKSAVWVNGWVGRIEKAPAGMYGFEYPPNLVVHWSFVRRSSTM